MKPLSQRRAFTGLMSLLTTAFVVGVWRQKYAYQSDFLADLIKITVLIALSTVLVSFVIWTIIFARNSPFKFRPLMRGAIAGGITALIIIPLPAFGWSLKTELIEAYQSSGSIGIGEIPKAIFVSIQWGLMTFVNITKASLVAVIGSIFVGAAITHYIPVARPNGL